MDLILPAAGLGTRLRPHTWTKPKPLVTLAGRTILEHVLERVMPANPEKIVFIVGYLGDRLQAWAADNLSVPTEFVVQPEMLGQTDAIIRCREVATSDGLILFPDAISMPISRIWPNPRPMSWSLPRSLRIRRNLG